MCRALRIAGWVGLALCFAWAYSRGNSDPDGSQIAIQTAHVVQFADGRCTATAVGHTTLLTATHCTGSPLVTIDGKPARVLWHINDGADHTLMGVTTHFGPTATHVAKPVVGERVWMDGDPGDLPPMLRSGRVSALGTGSGKQIVVYDVRAFFGDSGSGIFDGRGQLIGVQSMIDVLAGDGDLTSFAISFPLRFTAAQWARIQ